MRVFLYDDALGVTRSQLCQRLMRKNAKQKNSERMGPHWNVIEAPTR
jgi:hypothetical protein